MEYIFVFIKLTNLKALNRLNRVNDEKRHQSV